MKVRRRLRVRFSGNALSGDTPSQINAILAKTYGVVKPDLGRVIQFSAFCQFYGISRDWEVAPTGELW